MGKVGKECREGRKVEEGGERGKDSRSREWGWVHLTSSETLVGFILYLFMNPVFQNLNQRTTTIRNIEKQEQPYHTTHTPL